MSCLDDNTLFELSLGQLSLTDRQAAEEHLDGCATCRRALAETLRTSAARPERPPPVLAAGTAVGRYLVIARVGAGAMGQVFSAYDPELDRKVALKLLRPASSTEEHRARLAREAQTLARLSHPNVVSVFDVGTWEGQFFITLEFVSGGSARAWFELQRRGWKEVVALYTQAGRGLVAAHQAGVVHRDFKPDNVLVRADGRAQVTDFGLAASLSAPSAGSESRALTLTQGDALLGTPAYMAADQLEGRPATPASDQFSFAAALFEGLAGARPFEGQTIAELAANIRAGKVRPLSAEVPAAVRRVVFKGLAAKPEARFPSMAALVDALDAARSRSRRVGLFALGLSVIAALLAVAVSSSARSSLHPACALADARHRAAWDDARRQSLRQAFRATGLSYADRALDGVDAALRARTDTWRQERAEACEATLTPGASPHFLARLQCLDERWAELDATLRVLDTNGADAVSRAQRIVEALPAAEACTRPAVLARYGGDAGVCATCLTDQASVAEARALYGAGKFSQALEVAGHGLDGGLVSAPALAAMAFEQARALEELGQLDEAEGRFFSAALGAQRAGDGSLGAASWVELGSLVGALRSHPAEGERWVAQAEALAALARDGHLAARVASVRGTMAARRGQLPEAEAAFVLAEQLVRAEVGAAHPQRARALSNLGNAQLHQGRVDEALPKLQEAWALLAAALGDEHPDTFQALNSYGAALGTAERYEAAIPIFEKALAGYQKTLGAAHPRIGTAALNLAEAERRLNRLEAAQAHYALAATVWEKTDAPDRSIALAGQGEALLELGKGAEALKLLEQAVALCGRLECEPVDEGQANFLLARALRAARKPEAQVRARAQRALELLTPLGAGAAEQVDEVRALLR